MPHHHQHADLVELMSRAKHGQINSLEHQMHLQQEQLQQVRQSSMGLRQQREVDGFNNQLDLLQRPQRLPHSYEEQLSHLERTLSLQDQLQRGSLSFERSLSLPPGANMDVINAMAHAQGLAMQEPPSTNVHSAGQVGAFAASGVNSYPLHQTPPPNKQFQESRDDWMEMQIQMMHLSADRQKRESEVRMTYEDPNLWMSSGPSDENSKRLLMEMLQKKVGCQSVESIDPSNGLSMETMGPCSGGVFPGLSSSELKNSFAGEQLQNCFADDLESTENYRIEHGALSEGEAFYSGTSGAFTNPKIMGKYHKIGPLFEEVQEGMVEQARLPAMDLGEIPNSSISRQSSLGIAGNIF